MTYTRTIVAAITLDVQFRQKFATYLPLSRHSLVSSFGTSSQKSAASQMVDADGYLSQCPTEQVNVWNERFCRFIGGPVRVHRCHGGGNLPGRICSNVGAAARGW